MSQENVELVRDAFEAFLRRELRSGAGLLHPDVVWDASDSSIFDISRVYHGHEGVEEFWREWLGAWEMVEFEYELIEAGDRVVALIDQQMRGRHTHIEVPIGKYAQVWTFRDGLVVHWKLYESQAEALDAAGVQSLATNGRDGARIYFEDDGGEGTPVVFHGGFLDSVADLRESALARTIPSSEFRLIYVDHRGLGNSDKPHDRDAYEMRRRVADAVAVLDELGLERAHFIGQSWGGRLGFGIGEHAPERVRSLVIGGNQPYAWPDSPLAQTVTRALSAARTEGMEALVGAFEDFWEVEFAAAQRARWLDNDPLALAAAWSAAMDEGAIARDLRRWRVPCLIFLGATDLDFLDGARRAADEIPGAELLLLAGSDHYAAHVRPDEAVLEATLRVLRTS